MKKVFLGAAVLLILLGVGIFFSRQKTNEEVGCTMEAKLCPDGSSVGRSGPKCEFAPCPTPQAAINNEAIRIFEPLPNTLIQSPIILRGEARGSWYFEASFPVSLVDARGKELARMPVSAQGEWMTTNLVPFEASLSFPKPDTSTGELVFKKDNPSGLPENDAEVRVPVRFGP
ncbi:MAG: Gmad2 immunoglobulin-like domain-containing protein [Candidatus Moraniibacteriota bacterium]